MKSHTNVIALSILIIRNGTKTIEHPTNPRKSKSGLLSLPSLPDQWTGQPGNGQRCKRVINSPRLTAWNNIQLFPACNNINVINRSLQSLPKQTGKTLPPMLFYTVCPGREEMDTNDLTPGVPGVGLPSYLKCHHTPPLILKTLAGLLENPKNRFTVIASSQDISPIDYWFLPWTW